MNLFNFASAWSDFIGANGQWFVPLWFVLLIAVSVAITVVIFKAMVKKHLEKTVEEDEWSNRFERDPRKAISDKKLDKERNKSKVAGNAFDSEDYYNNIIDNVVKGKGESAAMRKRIAREKENELYSAKMAASNNKEIARLRKQILKVDAELKKTRAQKAIIDERILRYSMNNTGK